MLSVGFSMDNLVPLPEAKVGLVQSPPFSSFQSFPSGSYVFPLFVCKNHHSHMNVLTKTSPFHQRPLPGFLGLTLAKFSLALEYTQACPSHAR